MIWLRRSGRRSPVRKRSMVAASTLNLDPGAWPSARRRPDRAVALQDQRHAFGGDDVVGHDHLVVDAEDVQHQGGQHPGPVLPGRAVEHDRKAGGIGEQGEGVDQRLPPAARDTRGIARSGPRRGAPAPPSPHPPPPGSPTDGGTRSGWPPRGPRPVRSSSTEVRRSMIVVRPSDDSRATSASLSSCRVSLRNSLPHRVDRPPRPG